MSNIAHLITGKNAEEVAYNYLQAQNLVLVEKNFKCKYGELDLIMQDKNFLVFIEVRFRQNNQYGNSVESVMYHKQQRIIKAAQIYLQQKKLHNKMPCRFDIVGITKIKENLKINWIKSAFML